MTLKFIRVAQLRHRSAGLALWRKVFAPFATLLLSLGCSDPDGLFTITENPPIPATAAAAVPYAKPVAPTDLCADIACCRERLGVAVDGPCASASFIQGHCALVAAANGTDCGNEDPCASTVGSCQAGQCQTAPGLPVDCSGLDGPCAVGVCDSDAGGCVATPRTGEACDDGDACTTDDVCVDGSSCVGSALTCDDDDPCTDDACGEGGACTHEDNGSCADCKTVSDCPTLDKCDGVQTCAEGKCQLLPDSAPCALLVAEPCKALECVPETGDCVQVPTTGACDDGDACTTDDTCDATGACEGTALVCDDQNPCTSDSCAPDSGCTYAKTTGESCDDGDVCTTADACVDGTCASVPVVCDDGLPCTDDACEAGNGCVTTPGSGATCDDSDPCTADDTCVTGACVGTAAECSCTVDSDCKNFDDGNVCNGSETCEAGTCVLSTPPLTCDPDDDLADCLAPACSPSLGACAPAPVADGGSCTDDDPCTSLDACDSGECKGNTILCDDGDQCTTDSCNPALGCVTTPSNAACNDDDACTVGEKCAGGQCLGGAAVDCDDGQLCTADSCSKKSGCKYSPVSGACDDGSACTANDACLAGKCTGSAKPCPTGDLCAPSTCDPTSGQCKSSPKDCDDGSACTTDACDSNGECTHVPVTCTAPDACQIASCDPASGCKTSPKPCPEGGDACEVATCTAGVCGTAAKVCNDGDGCTTDSCDPTTGCQSVALSCTDGDACTTDSCVQGQCKFTAIVCNDGSACTTDVCSGGQCTTTPVVCNDGNACTTDSCDSAQGCKTAAIVCTDGVACTTDTCVGGTCVATPNAAACDDQDPCTTDSCGNGGCTYTLSTAPCDDGDACTTGDTCADGECKPATYTCGACVGKAEGEGCDDADAATVGDFCWKGWCRGFEKTLVPHASGGTLELNEVTLSGGEFLAISTGVTSGNGTATTSTLGLISLDGDLDLLPATASTTTAWAAIGEGVAVGDDLSVALEIGGNWSKGGWLSTALGSLGVAEISAGDAAAVWRDEDDGLVWVAGRGLNIDAKLRAWIARCDEGTSTCTVDSTQYTDFSKVEVPRSMTGIPGSQVLMISDYPLSAGSTKFYSDAFARKSFSPEVKWLLDYFDQESSSSRSADVALTESSAFWVGTGGLLRVRAKNAANATFWTKLTGLWVNQDKAAFSGVWMDDSITFIASTVAVLGNTVELQLVTHPTASTASTAANWRRISLGTVLPTETCLGDLCAPLGDVAANLQDVYSDGDNLVIVGWQVPSKGKRNAAIWVRRLL